jgi:hypothetical protein
LAGISSESAFLSGHFAGLLALLLPGLLPGLLTLLLSGLLPRLLALLFLGGLPAVLRLTFVVLIHIIHSPNGPKNNLDAHHPNYGIDICSSGKP